MNLSVTYIDDSTCISTVSEQKSSTFHVIFVILKHGELKQTLITSS